MRRSISCAFAPLLMLCAHAWAQDQTPLLDEILDYLKDKAFTVHVVARLLDSETVLVWDAEYTDVTIAGRGLKVRLVGGDIVIDASLVPFGSVESGITIVVYGELWYKDEPEEGVRYSTYVVSLPVELGERVILLPLGRADAVDSRTNARYTIELEIQLLPYQDQDDSEGADQTQ